MNSLPPSTSSQDPNLKKPLHFEESDPGPYLLTFSFISRHTHILSPPLKSGYFNRQTLGLQFLKCENCKHLDFSLYFSCQMGHIKRA